MTRLRVIAAVAAGSAAAALALGVVYAPGDGLAMGLFLLAYGAAVIACAHLLAARRRGSLVRHFTLAVGVAIGLITLGVGIVAGLMFISPHDGLVMAALLLFAGGLTSYSTWVLARGTVEDVESVRDGLRAVAEGRRDVTIATGARDELAKLAESANRMAAQLAERESERDAAEQARRDLVAAVSHDLRTPLTSLRLLVDAIQDDLVDDEVRAGYMRQLSPQIDSLATLVEDLFELSRLEAGEIQWSMQRVRLDALVEETIEAMRPQADARGVEVMAALPADLAPAHANPEKLQRVLFNLIQNAIRHTPADGSVTVAAQSNSEMLEVEVSDDGEGVPTSEREAAFQPFYRGGQDASRSSGGSGLGLTICRAIVEAHGGQIWFADATRGARVRFSLPRAS